MKARYHSSTIQRALNILNLFKDQPGLSFLDLQKKLGYNKTTLYRVLSTLLDNRYLAKDERGKYELGLNMFILGNRLSKEHHLIKVATPFMKELSLSLGLTAHLGILDGLDIIVIHKTEPNRLIKMVCQIGGSLPAHCTSQGKIHLAHSPKETTQRVIDRHGLQRYTPHTLCTTEGLLKELEEVRNRGYAIDDAEHEKNIRCIAVPISDETGRIEAALSAAGTVLDIPDEEAIQKVVDRLKEVGDRIRAEMGYISPAGSGI